MLHNSCRHTYADGSLARKVVEVTSEEDVSVQGFNVEKFSADSYVILPWKLSGFEHYVMSYTLQSIQTQFAIVAMVLRVYLFINYTGINAVNVRIIKVIIDKKNIVIINYIRFLLLRMVFCFTGTNNNTNRDSRQRRRNHYSGLQRPSLHKWSVEIKLKIFYYITF